jgi:hypothetical protein
METHLTLILAERMLVHTPLMCASETEESVEMVEVGEITGAFAFLASQASSLLTGTLLTIDGGYTNW